MHKLAEKATKALYEVLKRGRLHNLSIQCHLDLFDKIDQPILLYGCEVWGFSFAALESIHLNFVKFYLIKNNQLQIAWYIVSLVDTRWKFK